MGLSGPVRNISMSAQRVHSVCEDCVHADNHALEPRVICNDREAANFGHELYLWQPACDRHVARIGRDLSLHVYP